MPVGSRGRQTGNSLRQRAQADLKEVLTGRNGQVGLQELRSAWEAVHGRSLDLASYGASNVLEFVDFCRSVCRYVHETSCKFQRSHFSNPQPDF